MNVFLSFDIEIWCNGWNDLDGAFASSFDRYVYGRSRHGSYALPETLAILQRHGLVGVFFVEPLFAARFGTGALKTIVHLIQDAGQDVQLHLHPEWTDEAIVPIIPDSKVKRQHLTYYSVDEQTRLIAHGRHLLESVGSGPIQAFRSGSFAANLDTFTALRRNGIHLDSSLNSCHPISAPELRQRSSEGVPFDVQGVTTFPVSVFKDGFGRNRPAQVGACGARELVDALESAYREGAGSFVIVSHNFEMLRSGSSLPDWTVVKRFTHLCDYLNRNRGRFDVVLLQDVNRDHLTRIAPASQPRSSWLATGFRHLEQARRRLAQ